MEVSIVLKGSKMELDRFCDLMKWKRTEHYHRGRGLWTHTRVISDNNKLLGYIQPATSTKPCILELTDISADERSW